MNENCILRVMKNLNFLIILYTSVMIFCGLQGYIQENTAMNFLAQVNTLPEAPWKIPVLTIWVRIPSGSLPRRLLQGAFFIAYPHYDILI